MFIFLVIAFFILFFISFLIFKKDLFSPSVLVCIVYCISGLSALYNYKIWGLNNYHFKTAIIILCGLLTFILVSCFVYYLYNKKKVFKKFNIKYKFSIPKIIHLSKIFYILIFSFIFITFVWKIIDIIKIGSIYSESKSFISMIGKYRSIVSYSNSDIKYSPPFLLNQFTKVITAISYVFLYIIIRNLYNKDKITNNISYISFLSLFILYTLITGGRMPILKLAAAGIFYCFCFSNRKYNWEKNVSIKYIKIGILCLLVLFVSFYFMHGLLGRSKNFEPAYYVTMYAGGSLKLFDMYIDNPKVSSDFFGKESLYNINIVLGKLGILDRDYIKHLEFRRYNGLYLGNIYTPFRRYYADFGFLGVIIMTAIFSFVINLLYLQIKEKIIETDNNDFFLASYGMLIFTLFLYSIDDQFFTVIISINYVSQFILLFIFFHLFIHFCNKDNE